MSVRVRRTGKVLERLSRRVENPVGVLRQIGLYLKTEAQEKIATGSGFAPWAESTKKKYASTGTSQVTASGKVRSSYAARLDSVLRRKSKSEAREQLRRLASGLAVSEPEDPMVVRLHQRIQKATERKAQGKKAAIGKRRSAHSVLGKLVETFSVRLPSKAAVLVRNYSSFSAVQNEGGAVGKGAVLPARTFLEITAAAHRWISMRVAKFLVGE